MSKTEKTSQKGKKNVGYRLLAALLAVACVVFVFLPICVLKGDLKILHVEKLALFEILSDLFKSDRKLFGFLPCFTGTNPLGVISAISIYAFMLSLFLGFVFSVIAIFARKKSPALVQVAVYFLTWAFAGYAICILCISSYTDYTSIAYDLFAITFSIIGAFFYFILLLIKIGKTAWVNSIQFLLTLVYTAFIALAFTHDGFSVSVGINAKALWKILVYVFAGLAAFNLFVCVFRSSSKKGLAFDPVRYILMILGAFGVFALHYFAEITSRNYPVHAMCAVMVAFVQFIISVIQLSLRKSEAMKTEKAEAVAECQAQESIEAVPYEGGPVADVELAEEVTPVAEEPEAAATEEKAAAPENEYSGKFDPFIDTLTETEKSEFIDLYVLKCKVPMPEIPKYEVGEENKAFFNKVFIYLGQYRENISNELLNKIYTYSIKLS